MTSPLPTPSDRLEVLEAATLRLVETTPPMLSPEHRAAMDHVWAKAVQANPDLFDGPAVVCTATGYDGDSLVLSWAPVTYRHFALRRVPGAPRVSSVFVTIAQPIDAGGLVVGRMSASTAAPGRWQLPGGNVEPSIGTGVLDETELRSQACREPAEEIGVHATPKDLTLWAVTRGENGNIGMHYEAPPLPQQTVPSGTRRWCGRRALRAAPRSWTGSPSWTVQPPGWRTRRRTTSKPCSTVTRRGPMSDTRAPRWILEAAGELLAAEQLGLPAARPWTWWPRSAACTGRRWTPVTPRPGWAGGR
ncbi:NUDIX hydrolase [Kitasatospora sp. NPDC056446]|uniref:NUDIX hydrolase n=1 Tax=Kitasatospora sp. NPDC056446 TaxID=3345819 RepID=UPI00368D732B